MKFNLYSKALLSVGVLAMTACSSDDKLASEPEMNDGGVYATLTLSLPTASRATTVTPGDNPAQSSDGFEVGKDYENNVGSVLVVLATQETPGSYTYVTSSLADAHVGTSTSTANPVYNVLFETRALVEKAGQLVSVFAYCNPTTELIEAMATPEGFVDFIGSEAEGVISTKNGFLMTNAFTTTVTLPSKDDMDKVYNTAANPFNLGTVKVERAAARFDFAETTVVTGKPNLYPIYHHPNTDIDEDPAGTQEELVAYVQLDGMSLLNVAKNYYYLPRVSATGTDAGWTLCGQETPTNYVVSPGWNDKDVPTFGITTLNWYLQNYLYNNISEETGGYAINFVAYTYDMNLGDADNHESWNNPVTNTNDYKIWKYVTENTQPNTTVGETSNYQRKAFTTGVIFKSHLVAKDTEATTGLDGVINAGTDIIYAHNGILYGNLAMLKAAVLDKPVSALAEDFKVAFNVDDLTAEGALDNLTDLTESKGNFALYRPTEGKYNMYYAYYNRHNDNGNPAEMGAMEFAVVRNNVYKLAVSNILEFGHPGKPGDDPDPEDPDDPDETPKTYFRVQVEVLPWVVRVNNIIL